MPSGAPPTTTDVAIVGAGPTGLVAACELLRHGIRVRLIDARPSPSAHSKALLLWPRSMDVLDRLGVAPEAAGKAIPLRRFSYYSSGRPVARIDFDATTVPQCLPQRSTEEVLTSLLHSLGGTVERGHRLVELDQRPAGVRLVTHDQEGAAHTLTANWVIGADGAHSTVRDLLGIEFVGATYPNAFMLVDAFATARRRGAGGELLARDIAHYYQSPGGVLVVVPLPDGRSRFFVNAPDGHQTASLELLQDLVERRGPGGVDLADPEWISTFEVHHRLVTRMRGGRCFLAGDAAHIHSPAGGQGLNTGLQDAHNLAWKLAAVITGRAGPALLDTYHRERHAVARQVVRDTDIQTRAWLVSAPWKVRVRDVLLRAADATGVLTRAYAPVMAGRRITYPPMLRPPGRRARRHGGVGGAFPAGRLAAGEPADAYRLVTVGPAALAERAAAVAADWPDLVAHRTLDPAGGPLPCARDGYYLVRPDGYVADHGHPEDLESVHALLAAFHPASPTSEESAMTTTTEPTAGAATRGGPWVELGAALEVDAPGARSWVERIPRGEARPLHTHRRPWLTIVVSGGTAQVSGVDDAEPEDVELVTGTVKFNPLPAEGSIRHALRNTGDTDLVLVAVELGGGEPA
ncbi:FAD-dependent monooxygenase [Streptomyces hainanensis]|uniref:Monooxygenase n=1 Tax=Streptomyces hainanensis TaxID=402648 RepID=A0A4R4TLF5_9ACTN|nr:FAD-dependent monooxygenase [Streptomyces hainanensis]TDC78868.1 monooxygenase [Streptomyces hainanensis]